MDLKPVCPNDPERGWRPRWRKITKAKMTSSQNLRRVGKAVLERRLQDHEWQDTRTSAFASGRKQKSGWQSDTERVQIRGTGVGGKNCNGQRKRLLGQRHNQARLTNRLGRQLQVPRECCGRQCNLMSAGTAERVHGRRDGSGRRRRPGMAGAMTMSMIVTVTLRYRRSACGVTRQGECPGHSRGKNHQKEQRRQS